MTESIWAEKGKIDRLLAKLQMDAVEQHVKDNFTLNLAQRNRTRLKIKDIVTAAPTKGLKK